MGGCDKAVRVDQHRSNPGQPSDQGHVAECKRRKRFEAERALSASLRLVLLPFLPRTPSHSQPARMGFPEFTNPAGLQSLEAHLADKSYIEG